MKILIKGRYALRVMSESALRPDECMKINWVTKRQQTSGKYPEQIIIVLSCAGYVKGMCGAQDGYMLTKEPSEYTANVILCLIEGSLISVTCLDVDEPCGRSSTYITLGVWRQLNDIIN